MTENGVFKSFYAEILRGVPLLQSGGLVKAEEIARPENLSDKQLLPLWRLGKGFLQGNPIFIAVAFTQFCEKSLKIVNGDPLLRRIIFFPQILADGSDSYRDCLLINPRIFIPPDAVYYASVENCGSVEFARLGMVVKRPNLMLLKTHIWEPGGKIFRASMSLEGINAGIIQHEYIHLEGKDATFFPEDILDFTDPKYEWWNNSVEVQENEGWLIHKEGKFIIVDNHGKYVRDFKS